MHYKSISVFHRNVTVEEISYMLKLLKHKYPVKFIVTNMIDVNSFIQEFGEEKLSYSFNGLSTVIHGNTSIYELLKNDNTRYIFSNIIDTKLFIKMNRIFPRFRTNINYVVARIYCGKIGTGSHFHFHEPALNYLISGRKQWIILPPTEKNVDYYNSNISYLSQTTETTKWLNGNIVNLINNTENVIIFTQEEKTVVYVPKNWLHFVTNLSTCIGITYSWESFS